MLPSDAPLSEWLAWLETLSPKEIDLGLERVQRLQHRLNLRQPQHRLLIAGTNGKGSSVAVADALLRASGKTVGAYTSPHILRYNERIVVDGAAVEDSVLIAAFERVEAERGDIPLTYFEFGTLAAELIFSEANLDVWVLEVGLGGRLDATNAIDPTASLITNVALDHCDWLGSDIETIAVEKSGVMRSGRPTVYGGNPVPRSVLRASAEKGAKLLVAGTDFDARIHADGSWTWRSGKQELGGLKPPGLLGEFQIHNAAAVMALLEAADLMAGVDANLLNDVLPSLSVGGRCQHVMAGDRHWLFDVAHNPAASEALQGVLTKMLGDRRVVAIVGVLDDKDVAGILNPLAAHIACWIAVTPRSHRAIAADELGRQISNMTHRPCLIAESFDAAVEFARRKASENDRILVTGSFFTVGPVLECLSNHPRSNS
jgi:dihydrofolate synthase/folylpolyglutamate synthase